VTDTAISVENLSKLYKIGVRQQGYKTLRESVMGILTAPFRRLAQRAKRKANPAKHSAPGALRSSSGAMLRAPCSLQSSQSDDHIWALKDVSFEIKQGEVVGIIGRNGAGKTTLLKILSRITEPTDGRAVIRGRVGSLLEVGTGFHPELTGRENIYLNGAILGMRIAQIGRKFDEIVDFAEIEKFIDTPVKRYSSGMYVRLAFAVAAHLEPEILLVDEVLAVGDAAFQKKCIGKIGDVVKEGRTVLFVSHNMGAIKFLCTRTILFENGRICLDGDSNSCVEAYISESLRHFEIRDVSHFRRNTVTPATPAFFKEIRVINTGTPRDYLPLFSSGEDIQIDLEFAVRHPVRNVTLTLVLSRTTGEEVATFFSGDQGISIDFKPPRETWRCKLKGIPLVPGTYQADIGLNQTAVSRAYDVLVAYPLFTISDVPQTRGNFPNRAWGALYWDNVEWEQIEA
jgi:lipopolysaccharide transport system ATP-binding protein